MGDGAFLGILLFPQVCSPSSGDGFALPEHFWLCSVPCWAFWGYQMWGIAGRPRRRSAGAQTERGEGRESRAGHGTHRWLILGPGGTIQAHPSLFCCHKTSRGCRAPKRLPLRSGGVHTSLTPQAPRNRHGFEPGAVNQKSERKAQGGMEIQPSFWSFPDPSTLTPQVSR